MRPVAAALPFAISLLLAAVGLTHAQATANAVVSAEDAFGSSEGDESVGIYDQTSVRGFNLEAAGNYRINGRYFVRNSGFSTYFVEKVTVRIGLNALPLDYPGPSGVVDYKLRDPRRGEPSQLTVGMDAYEQPFADLHFKYRNPAETFSASLGVNSRFAWANEQGGEGRDALLGGTFRASARQFRFQMFGGEYRYHRNGRFRIALGPTAVALPAEIERGHYLGQPWATEAGARRIFGGLADLNLEDGWSARIIGVFSEDAPDSKFTQLFAVDGADPVVRSSYIVAPKQRSSSYSGELRLGRTFVTGAVAHNAALSARWRESRNGFGGEQFIDTGLTALGEPAASVTFPGNSASRVTLHDRIDQRGVGLSDQMTLGKRVKVNAGFLYSNYQKRFAGAGSTTINESAPWLYNFGVVTPLAEELELYGSFTRGLEEAGTAPLTASNANTILEAVIATQKELGLRFALDPGLVLIVAGFDTRKPQTGVRADTGAFEFIGDVRHRGIETSLSGALTPQLSAVIGAVYTDAEVSGGSVSSRLIGSQPVNVPEWRAVANLNYELTNHFSLDAGVEYVGRRAARSLHNAGTTQQLQLRDSTVVDIGARYRIDARVPVAVRAQILNALDKFAWKSAPGETLEYLPQRSVRLLVTMDF